MSVAIDYELTLEVRALPRANASSNVHWRTKVRDRKEWTVRMKAAMKGKQKPPSPLSLSVVLFERHSSSEPDYANLVNSFKLVEDLLQPKSQRNPGGLGILEGDKSHNYVGGHADYVWKKAPPGKGKIVIHIEGVSVHP